MPPPIKTAKEIFLEAAEQADLPSRARYLSEACGGDAELRRHVEALLRVHDEPDSLLDQERIPAPVIIDREAASPTLDQPVERPGTQIGPYKLLQQIGEGGMGVVYMAEQEQPVRRRVALKIIKPGMDSRQVIARFEAERQALSLMDHPNIAKVLDAGTTDSGRPYFVMELVKGQPITQYCDEHHLTPRQRLELLLPVCQAIQHAHQKGIIHRDIKPTNILVAEYDQKAVPKVIDFGVAKATSQALTERTVFTGFGQIVGTLEYMSPEQAKVNQLDIDTRSDIYSLGVLLYELLTGSTPFDKQRLRSAAFDEMLRIIREEEPPKPSTRLSDSSRHAPRAVEADGTRSVPITLASIAALRQTEPARLTKLVRGELDWIVMKALEKDRSRRYETANALANDLQHYLNDEPVVACPPSAGYRLRKFARRNRTALAIGLTLFVAFIGLSVGSSMAAVAYRNLAERNANLVTQKDAALVQVTAAETRARKAQQVEAGLRKEAESARNSAQVESQRAKVTLETIVNMLAMANPNDERGQTGEYTVQQMLLDMAKELPQELDHQPAIKAEIQAILGRGLTQLSMEDAELHIQEALRLRTAIYGDKHPKVAESLTDHACYLRYWGISSTLAERHCRCAIQILRDHPEETELMLNAYGQLAKSLVIQKKLAELEVVANEAIEFARRHKLEDHRRIATLRKQVADAWLEQGRGDEAESLARQAWATIHALKSTTPLENGWTEGAHAHFHARRKNYAESELHFRAAIEVYRHHPRHYRWLSECLVGLQPVMQAQGRDAEFRQFALDLANQGGIRSLAVLGLKKLLRGDVAGYQNDCRELLELCSNSADLDALDAVTFACTYRQDALQDWTLATSLAQRLVGASPESSWNQATLGAILYRAGKFEASLAALNRSEQLDTGREGMSRDRQLAAIRRWFFLALANHQVGNSQQARQWRFQAANALDSARRRIAAGESFGWANYRSHLFDLLQAEAAELAGRDGIEQSLREDAKVLANLAGAHPDVSGYRELLADTHNRLGDLLNVRKEFDEAEQEYRRALILLQKLHSESPVDANVRTKLGSVLQGLGRALQALGKLDGAEQTFRQSVAIREKLTSDFPNEFGYQVALAHTYLFLAWALQPGAKTEAREQLFRQAAAQFEKVQQNEDAAKERPFMIANLANTRRELAGEFVTQKRMEEAETAYRQAVELLASVSAEPYTATNRTDTQSLRISARMCYSTLIEFLMRSSRHEEAAEVCRQAVQFYERLATERPDVQFLREELEKRRAELAKLKDKK